jgi:REP element-mobilizing transposase RayT
MHNYIYFFTATILNWQNLLKPDKYKQIICDSLNYLVKNNRVTVYGFVIMPNHIHIIWQINEPDKIETVQRDFLKYTAQQIKFDLLKNHQNVLAFFKSNAKDRAYQFWERRAYTSKLYNRKVVEEKLNYIHNNPISKKWNLCSSPELYKYSSASYYLSNINSFAFITDYRTGI